MKPAFVTRACVAVLASILAGCLFAAQPRIRFDKRLGALIGCGGGAIGYTIVTDLSSNKSVFDALGRESKTVDTLYIVPGDVSPPAGVTVARLAPNRAYEISVRQGDADAVVHIWTDANARVDSTFVVTPCPI